MNGVTTLASKGERVLALAELVLDKGIYNTNIYEPIIENKYDIDDIGRGSKLYCFKGPYVFEGTSAETLNFLCCERVSIPTMKPAKEAWFSWAYIP